MRMQLGKICLSFLDTRGCGRKGMLSHIPARSLPSLSWTQNERKSDGSGCVPSLSLSLCRETPRQSQEEETERGRRGSGFLPPNRQRLPMKGDAVQLDLQGDAEVVLTQGQSVMDARPLEHTKGAKTACLSFLVFYGIKANLLNILS